MSFPSRSAVAQAVLLTASIATLLGCSTIPRQAGNPSVEQQAPAEHRPTSPVATTPAPTPTPIPMPMPAPANPAYAPPSPSPAAAASVADYRSRAAITVPAYAPHWTPPPPDSTAKYTAFSDNPWQRATEQPVSSTMSSKMAP